MQTILKPCPFCGNGAFIEKSEPPGLGRAAYLAHCKDAFCLGHHDADRDYGDWSNSSATPEEAAEKWNTRVED